MNAFGNFIELESLNLYSELCQDYIGGTFACGRVKTTSRKKLNKSEPSPIHFYIEMFHFYLKKFKK